MRPRGFLTTLAAVIALGLTAIPAMAATPPTSLDVVLPGSFVGCTVLDNATSPALASLLDLIRPSAFLTDTSGDLVGAGGPIDQAELVSLQPQTVVYGINTSFKWSNGTPFNADDLLSWYEKAKLVPSSATDGYRLIKTIVANKQNTSITVVFKQSYADWNLLFRDVEERSTPTKCALSSLVGQPSLGPYRLLSLSATTAQLASNPNWPGASFEFPKLTISTDQSLSTKIAGLVARYALNVSPSYLAALNSSGSLASHIGVSDQLALVGFSPLRTLTKSLLIREALALSLNRQAILNQEWGSLTYGAGVASSILYSQGQSHYPGSANVSPYNQSTTTTTQPSTLSKVTANTDCPACAISALKKEGFAKKGNAWVRSGIALSLRLVTTKSSVDNVTANIIIHQWANFGIPVHEVYVASNQAVANALALGTADVGVYTKTSAAEPGSNARSWTGHNYFDSVDLGWRSKTVDQLYAQGLATFNPVTATNTWYELDDTILNNYWARPLFTAPAIISYSNDLATVYGSTSLNGFIDQVPNWRYQIPQTTP
jgi:ABC-type transport system substrate-binding protein